MWVISTNTVQHVAPEFINIKKYIQLAGMKTFWRRHIALHKVVSPSCFIDSFAITDACLRSKQANFFCIPFEMLAKDLQLLPFFSSSHHPNIQNSDVRQKKKLFLNVVSVQNNSVNTEVYFFLSGL